MLGGYTTGCAGRTLDPANTILDGNQTNSVLGLLAPDVAAEFVVEGLTLRKGLIWYHPGGGLYAVVGTLGTVTVNRNRIENNTTYHGGGVFISASTATLPNNSITGNTSSSSSDCAGGGVYLAATTATLINNSLMDNMSCYYGGGVCIISSFGSVTLFNNIMWHNSGGYGSGTYIVAVKSDVEIIGNNYVLNSGHHLGAIYLDLDSESNSTNLYNNLFLGNIGYDAYIVNDGDGDGFKTPVKMMHNNFGP